jgi:SAM-dependent methyltransferase
MNNVSLSDDIELEFLVVDEFLRTLVDARALKSAFELGLIDYLVDYGSATTPALAATLAVDAQGMEFLLGLLRLNRVVAVGGHEVRLHDRFAVALRYRDLLEMKLDFAGAVMNDFADLFTALLKDPGRFTGSARLYQIFDYRRALQPSTENYQRTRGWMRLTSTFTRYEALACMQLHDFGNARRMLDIGGNSGEFLLQLCRRHPRLKGTVMDLPLVAEIGMEHVLPEPEHKRIGFLKADIRTDPVPAGYDLIAFKSMLHDWPADQAAGFIAKAAEALAPGGTLLIFERGPLRLGEAAPPFSLLPILLFFRSYREPDAYLAQLEALGFIDPACRHIELDSPFFLVSARKPAA